MKILIARIYMMESEKHLDEVLDILHDDVKVKHVTVFRGIEGFEEGGKVSSAHFLSLSLDLPLVVEFFDSPGQVKKALDAAKKVIEKGHCVTFTGTL